MQCFLAAHTNEWYVQNLIFLYLVLIKTQNLTLSLFLLTFNSVFDNVPEKDKRK